MKQLDLKLKNLLEKSKDVVDFQTVIDEALDGVTDFDKRQEILSIMIRIKLEETKKLINF